MVSGGVSEDLFLFPGTRSTRGRRAPAQNRGDLRGRGTGAPCGAAAIAAQSLAAVGRIALGESTVPDLWRGPGGCKPGVPRPWDPRAGIFPGAMGPDISHVQRASTGRGRSCGRAGMGSGSTAAGPPVTGLLRLPKNRVFGPEPPTHVRKKKGSPVLPVPRPMPRDNLPTAPSSARHDPCSRCVEGVPEEKSSEKAFPGPGSGRILGRHLVLENSVLQPVAGSFLEKIGEGMGQALVLEVVFGPERADRAGKGCSRDQKVWPR